MIHAFTFGEMAKKSSNDRYWEHVLGIKCPARDCERFFDTKEDLKQHMKTHPRLFLCEVGDCLDCMMSRKDEIKHLKTVHGLDRPYICEGTLPCGRLCRASFMTITNRKRHEKDVHEKKQFPCTRNGCGMIFSRKGKLEDHINTVHLKKRLFNCTYCSHTATNSSNMVRHRQTHF